MHSSKRGVWILPKWPSPTGVTLRLCLRVRYPRKSQLAYCFETRSAAQGSTAPEFSRHAGPLWLSGRDAVTFWGRIQGPGALDNSAASSCKGGACLESVATRVTVGRSRRKYQMLGVRSQRVRKRRPRSRGSIGPDSRERGCRQGEAEWGRRLLTREFPTLPRLHPFRCRCHSRSPAPPMRRPPRRR
jgi:hypothetical protein